MRRLLRKSCFFWNFNVQIRVFDSVASQDPIIRVSANERGTTVSFRYSGDHYGYYFQKLKKIREPDIYHKMRKK